MTKEFSIFLALTAVFIASVTYTIHPAHFTQSSDEKKALATVMITNIAENHGGTGVVLKSTSTESQILTNAHVCGVVKNGGVVKNEYYRGFVSSYTLSSFHDLCLIKTDTNFHTNTSVATDPPPHYSQASISGHPKLYPTIITKGSFSSKQIVTVMTGFRPCTEEDAKNPDNTLVCLLLGGFPTLKNYEAQFVGATIQGGNSGSAVYNEDGEVAALVFAGSGDLSYALVVPQEYVYNFVNKEVPMAKFESPNTEQPLDTSDAQSRFKSSCLKLAMGDQSLAVLEKYCKFYSRLDY
jgi:hypothetical protein